VKRGQNTELAKLRRQARYEAENFFSALTTQGQTDEVKRRCAWDLATASLRLHMFEKGHRAGRRGSR
jgi:hypothetical protein